MGLTTKETPAQPPVKLSSQEFDYIFQARKNLDDVTELVRYAALYKSLGWPPVAFDAQEESGLQVDFEQPQAAWSNMLMDLALKRAKVSLAIRLEPDSRLFVLRVSPVFGQEYLDGLGDWRSRCIAQAGDSWENHFLVLPQTWALTPERSGDGEEAPLSVMGPGSVVPVPPTTEPASRECWRWLQPPWEQPPWHPSPELLILLEETGFISRSLLPEEDLPAWDDLYPVICGAEGLRQAVVTPVASTEQYGRNVLEAALRAGWRDPRMLRGLLWHAPYGGMGQGIEGRQQLSRWALEIEWRLAAEGLRGEDRSLQEAGARGQGPGAAPGNGWDELQVLASLAEELEQEVEELERRQSGTEETPGGRGQGQ